MSSDHIPRTTPQPATDRELEDLVLDALRVGDDENQCPPQPSPDDLTRPLQRFVREPDRSTSGH